MTDRRMTTEKLQPCPFCGASASIEEIDGGSRGAIFSVGCDSTDEDSCMGYQSFQTFARRGDAIAAWNKRARASAPAEADGWDTDMDNAPRDGSEVLFPIEFIGRAYWDDELKRWVLTFPLRMDYVNAPTRFRLPRAEARRILADQQKPEAK